MNSVTSAVCLTSSAASAFVDADQVRSSPLAAHCQGGRTLGVCCFVLLNQYWGIVTVPGSFLESGDLG